MYCAPKQEVKGMVDQIVKLMAAVAGQSEEKVRKESRAEAEKFFAQRGEQMPSDLLLNTSSQQKPRAS
jgi:hypothetical protein